MALMIRHGDILLEPIAPPAGAEMGAGAGEYLVLAEGEQTGHAHRLYGLVRAGVETDAAGQPATRVVEVKEPAELVHEEHNPVPVPPGWYRLRQQRAYSPVAPVTPGD